jgi:hypothetical protein
MRIYLNKIVATSLLLFLFIICKPNNFGALTQYNTFSQGNATASVFSDSPVQTQNAPAKQNQESAPNNVTWRVIPAANNTYGYEILVNQKMIIHQLNIPGQAGSEGFSSSENAGKVAKLVADKVRNNIMPPTVSPEELKQLNVIK